VAAEERGLKPATTCWAPRYVTLVVADFSPRPLHVTLMHNVPIEDSIDLHTFQPKEIAIVVEEYLYQAQQRGFREVRIIHGRGIGVQREIVHSILKKHPDVVGFCDLPDRGSTVVALRRT